MKPIVDGLEQELAGRIRVLRVNVQDPAGKALAADLRIRVTPTFVFFDASGVESWRSVGRLDVELVRSSGQ